MITWLRRLFGSKDVQSNSMRSLHFWLDREQRTLGDARYER